MFSFLKIFRLPQATIFGRSGKWSTVRKNHLKDHPSCAACGRSKKVEVHHIEPYHLNPSRELDPTNLITLCADPCHIVFGHFMNFKSYNPDVVEMCHDYYQALRQGNIYAL